MQKASVILKRLTCQHDVEAVNTDCEELVAQIQTPAPFQGDLLSPEINQIKGCSGKINIILFKINYLCHTIKSFKF